MGIKMAMSLSDNTERAVIHSVDIISIGWKSLITAIYLFVRVTACVDLRHFQTNTPHHSHYIPGKKIPIETFSNLNNRFSIKNTSAFSMKWTRKNRTVN